MKARVFTEAKIRKIAKDEAERRTMEIYEQAARDVAYQAFAVCFVVLAHKHGFGKKRLNALKDNIEREFMQMKESTQPYDANDCVKWLKEKYDVDFSKSIYDGGAEK